MTPLTRRGLDAGELERSRTLVPSRHKGLSSSLLRARSLETFKTRPALPTSRVVANSSPRQTHERRVLHEGASFALYAGISRGGPGRAVAACLSVLTAGSTGSPAGRPDGPKVSPGLSAGGCRVKSGSGPLERSLPPGSGALGRGRPVANCDPWVMIFRSTRLQTAQVISEGPRFAGSP